MRQRHTVIYDGECRFCQRGIAGLRRLDWLERFDCLPAADAQTALRHPQLAYEALMRAVHCVTAAGAVWRDAEAVRFIAGRVPLFMPVWLVLHLPGMLRLAAWLYRAVSQHRYRLGGQCQTGCGADVGRAPKAADGAAGREAARGD